MTEFSARHFYLDLSKKHQAINSTVSGYISASFYAGASDSEELDFLKRKLEFQVQEYYTGTALALEALGLSESREELKAEYNAQKSNLTTIDVIPYIDEPMAPAAEVIGRFVNAIGAGLHGDDIEESRQAVKRGELEIILKGTDGILKLQNVVPNAEADVTHAVTKHLQTIYPDTVTDISIGHESKPFKPDVGIRSLKTAIEFKYAVTERELKTAISGIFEDINGYSGSEQWRWFFAVIYQTDEFITQERLDSQFATIEGGKNWRCLLVKGGGARRKQGKAENTASDTKDKAKSGQEGADEASPVKREANGDSK